MSTHHSPSSSDEALQQRLEMLQRFYDYLRYERNASPKTLSSYSANLRLFDEYLQREVPDVTWATMDTDIIRDWIVDLMDEGLKASSVHTRLSALRSFYKFMLRRGYVTSDPAHCVTGPKMERPLPSFVRESEMDKLLDEATFPDTYVGLRDRTILLTLYSTGLRASELTGLRLADVDLAQMQLKVTGKRNKQRIVPFGEELKNELQRYLDRRAVHLQTKGKDTDAFFLTATQASPLKYQGLRLMVNNYLSLVTTAKKKSPHTLRHTFATTMLNHDADLRSVKELLGHVNLATTEIYTHASFADLQRIYQQAHPRSVEQPQQTVETCKDAPDESERE